jgi:hypothetical protein
VPRLCGFCPGICLTNEEKAQKKLSQGSHSTPFTPNKVACTTASVHYRAQARYLLRVQTACFNIHNLHFTHTLYFLILRFHKKLPGGDIFALRLSFVSIIPPVLHSHLHPVHVALARRTNGRELETFQKSVTFRKSGSIGWKSTSNCSFNLERWHCVPSNVLLNF